VNGAHEYTIHNRNTLFCRNLGIGLCSSVARVGGTIAPLMLLMVRYSSHSVLASAANKYIWQMR